MGIITDILKDIPLSTVLRERLIDQERVAAEQLTVLNGENKNLKSKIAELEEIIRKHDEDREEISKQPKEQPFHDNLPDEQKRILAMLSNSGMNESKIIETMDKRDEAVRYDIEELKLSGLVNVDTMMGITFVSLTHDGRKYLKKIGVI